jgi:hypothetical protein
MINSASDEISISKNSESKNSDLVNKITFLLISIVNDNEDRNFSNQYKIQKKHSFYCSTPASITIGKYIERIVKYTYIEDSTLILAMIYIDRICQYNENILLIEKNLHRILFASILLAIKINEDEFFTNSYYSKVAGIYLWEINRIEYDFTKLIDFNFFVSKDLFEKYKALLIN